MRIFLQQLGLIEVVTLLLQPAKCYNEVRENNFLPLRYGNASISLNGNFGARVGLNADPVIGSMRQSSLIKRQLECPVGTIPCGEGDWCHPPDTECCPNPAVSCPTGDSCCAGSSGCATAGYSCCSNRPYTCPIGGTCCPEGDLNCAPAGGSCCGTGACPTGEECCNGQSCAPTGGSCCGDMACLADEKCCNDSHCAPSTAVCCGDGYCDEGNECCGNGSGCAKPGYVCCDGTKQSCPAGDLCCEDSDGPYCSQSSTCLPTLKFPHVPGITDELQANTCKGLQEFLSRGNKNEFNWNGPGSANRAKTKANRIASGCGGGLSCPAGQNCDEFPLASFGQGGKGASIDCVPDWLNGFYGYFWEAWRREQVKTGFNEKTLFRITVEDCVLDDLSKKKRASNVLVLNSHDNLTIFNGSAFGNYTLGNNVVFRALTPDNSNTGTYTFNYTLDSGDTMSSGLITDGDGEPYANLSTLQVGSSSSNTFQLADYDSGPVYFYGLTQAKDVQLNVTINTPPPSSTTTTSSQGMSVSTASSTGSATSAPAAKSAAKKMNPAIALCWRFLGSALGVVLLICM